MGSGEACTDEFVVMMAVSGDMTGEPCWELEAIEDTLVAEVGIEFDACVSRLV